MTGNNTLRSLYLLLHLTLFASCAHSEPGPALRKAPYLIFPGNPTTMQVLWQSAVTGPALIEWGTDTGYDVGRIETQEYGTDHQHTVTLTDLEPGELYFYQVEFDGTKYPGSFRAAPVPGTDRVKFFAYGDTRTDVQAHNKVAGQVLAAIAADPASQTMILSVGDLVSKGDNEKVLDGEFYSTEQTNIRRMMASLPYQSCIGNHEYGGRAFVKYFPYPFVGGRYWSFDYGPAHIIVVDQYESYAPGSDQYAWIKNDLETTTQPWVFVVLHEPGWSAGGGHSNCKPVQRYLQPLFVKYGVSLVFGGHNHYYARAEVDGVQHLTVGGGGAPLYTPTPGAANIVTATKSHHFSRITIEGDRLGFAAISGTTVLDTFTLNSRDLAH